MKKSILVHGSLAFDLFFYYPESIREHLIAASETLYLNFRAAGPEKMFGGCAGNTAHTAALFGIPSAVSSWAGRDAGTYLKDLRGRGVDTSQVHIATDHSTPTAVLLRDRGENQWIIFGEPQTPVEWDLPELKETALAVITSGMTERIPGLIEELIRSNIPYIIDPGKMIADLPPAELVFCIEHAEYCVLNFYEAELLRKSAGLSVNEVSGRIQASVITNGRNGCDVISRGKLADGSGQPAAAGGKDSEGGLSRITIPAVPDITAADPYGAGDAFLGGFSAAVFRGASAAGAARTGTVAASFAIESRGTRNHTFTADEFLTRYRSCFGEPELPLFT